LQSIRVKLEETLPGTGGGSNQHDELVVKFLFLLPLCALLFCIYRSIQVKTSLVPSPRLHSSFLDCNLILCFLISRRAVRVHCAGARSAIRLDIFITKLDLMEHLVMAVYLP